MSLSTVIALKLRSVASLRMVCSSGAATAQSVKTKPSIVARLGAIMPDPLTMPWMVTRTPSTIALAVAPLAKVSVVPIAAVAAAKPALPSAAWAAATTPVALSRGKGTPMTPVEATNTSSARQPIAAATVSTWARLASRPAEPVKAFELPALTIRAREVPPGSAARHHSTSGEGHLDRVSTPATVVPTANSASKTSARVQFL